MYYFWSDDQQVGPYTIGQVRTMWDGGQITPDSLYWETGLPEWQPVAIISHLIEEAEPTVLELEPEAPPPLLPQPVLQPVLQPVPRAVAPQEFRPTPRADAKVEERPAPVDVIQRWILNIIFCLAVPAFFLPNLNLELPILGRISMSMLDLLTPAPSGNGGNSIRSQMPSSSAKPNAWGVMRENQGNLGGVVCGTATLGLFMFYILTIAWGVCAFILNKSYPMLNFMWLALAIQFPILFLIGSQILISGMRRSLASDLAGNPFAVFGQAMVNDVAVEPGLITWFLMGFGVLALALPKLVRRLVLMGRG